MKQLKTKRLLLRDITLDDAPYMLAQLNDVGWLKNIGDREVRSLEAASEYIKTRVFAHIENNGFGMYVAQLSNGISKGEIIGQCGIIKREGLDDPDIGFALLEKYCGQGYGYEMAKAVVAHAYNELKIKKLVAITADENVASQALLRKLGMTHTQDVLLPNIEGNNMYYEFVTSEA